MMCQGVRRAFSREGTLPCLETHFIIWSQGRGATGNYRAQARDAARPLMTYRPILMAKMHQSHISDVPRLGAWTQGRRGSK